MQAKQYQTDADKIANRIYAALETGNTDQARISYTEYKELDEAAALLLGASIIRDYGVNL